MPPRVHIVGAGLAGLAAALRLSAAGRRVTLYEATAQAGGRCRSFHDDGLQRVIDNGNHILLSANTAALAYLDEIGARDSLIEAPAQFPFLDLQSGARWILRPGQGTVPWWLLDPRRRVPGSRPSDLLGLWRLLRADASQTVGDCLDPASPLWQRFWRPLCAAVLNTAPQEAAAQLLARVLRDSFARGEAACRPLIARDSLAASFIDPALAKLRGFGADVRFNARLRRLALSGERVSRLDFGDTAMALDPGDRVVCALPPSAAAALLPDLTVPRDSRPIVNAHLRLSPAQHQAAAASDSFLGLVGGTADWLFRRGDVVSLTVSAAETLVETDNRELGERLWRDTAKALRLAPDPAPPLRLIKEKRATFAQTPANLARRPAATGAWRNLLLAGDWTDTGYPATIESAVRSGHSAATLLLAEAPDSAVPTERRGAR